MAQGSTPSSSPPPVSSSNVPLGDVGAPTSADSPYSMERYQDNVKPGPRKRDRLYNFLCTSGSNVLEPSETGTAGRKPVEAKSSLDDPAPSDSEASTAGDNPDRDGNDSSDETLLTDAERSMYASEWQDNFRWLSKLAGSCAKDCKLAEVEPEKKERVDEIGMYSELVYSYIPVSSLFENYEQLKNAGILPHFQPVLSDCDFISKIDGPKTDISAFVVYRRSKAQLVVSISGSSSPKHLLENLRVVRTPWHGTSEKNTSTPLDAAERVTTTGTSTPTNPSEPPTPVPTVHSGFLRLYRDIKEELHKAIREGLKRQPKELIITGHSMGGSVSHLLCIDVLSGSLGPTVSLPGRVCLSTYGTPRTGSPALVKHFRGLVDEFRRSGSVFDEYAVKAYNDGVPAVPPRIFGYAHFAQEPMYAFHKHLYAVPLGNEEASLFQVYVPQGPLTNETQPQPPDSQQVNRFPRGGHNYYNGRDLEGFRRVTRSLESAGFPRDGWQKRFEGKVKEVVGAEQQNDTSSAASQQ